MSVGNILLVFQRALQRVFFHDFTFSAVIIAILIVDVVKFWKAYRTNVARFDIISAMRSQRQISKVSSHDFFYRRHYFKFTIYKIKQYAAAYFKNNFNIMQCFSRLWF